MESIVDLKRKEVHRSLGSYVSNMEMKRHGQDIFISVMPKEDQKTPSLLDLMVSLEASSTRMAFIKIQLSTMSPFLIQMSRKCQRIMSNP